MNENDQEYDTLIKDFAVFLNTKKLGTNNIKSEQTFEGHHISTLKSYEANKLWWKERCSAAKQPRCKICWLLMNACCCSSFIDQRKTYYRNMIAQAPHQGDNENMVESADTEREFKKSNLLFDIAQPSIIIYFHHSEIGRTINTGHIFQAICPFMCASIILGDAEKEDQLINELKAEVDVDNTFKYNNNTKTFILYPSLKSISLNEWLSKQSSTTTSTKKQRIRFIVLDGTYRNASNQLKYLEKRSKQLGFQLPLVKLDLDHVSAKSAFVGLINQPSKEKICTFQAIVMAMASIGVNNSFCKQLREDLTQWLNICRDLGVKQGKS